MPLKAWQEQVPAGTFEVRERSLQANFITIYNLKGAFRLLSLNEDMHMKVTFSKLSTHKLRQSIEKVIRDTIYKSFDTFIIQRYKNYS